MVVSNFELADCAMKHKINLKLTDIITKDQLVNVKCTKIKNLIINFAKEGQEGTHFVALLIRNKNAFYCDSFGQYPLQEVITYCKANGLKLGFNSYIIQNMQSTACGIYTIALIRYVGVSGDLYNKCNDYINLFDENTKENEKILFDYVHSIGIHDFD